MHAESSLSTLPQILDGIEKRQLQTEYLFIIPDLRDAHQIEPEKAQSHEGKAINI